MTRAAGFLMAETVFSTLSFLLAAMVATTVPSGKKQAKGVVFGSMIAGAFAGISAFLMDMLLLRICSRAGIWGAMVSIFCVFTAIMMAYKFRKSLLGSPKWASAFALCVAGMLILTIFIRVGIQKEYYIFVNPLEAFRLMAQSSTEKSIAHFLKNIALFVPFGFLLGWKLPDARSLYAITLAGAWMSAWIELTQLLLNMGECDIADVIGNTCGTLIGASLAVVIARRQEGRKRA